MIGPHRSWSHGAVQDRDCVCCFAEKEMKKDDSFAINHSDTHTLRHTHLYLCLYAFLPHALTHTPNPLLNYLLWKSTLHPTHTYITWKIP